MTICGGAVISSETWAYYYDAEGREQVIQSPQGYVRYDYDPITGSKSATYSYSSDKTIAQVLATPAANDTTRVGCDYDELGRLKTVKTLKRDGLMLGVPEVTNYGYNEVGSRRTLQYPNGATAVCNYNAVNRLIDLTNYVSMPANIDNPTASDYEFSSFAYPQHADGIRESLGEGILKVGGNPAVSGDFENHTVGYLYDKLNRVKQELGDDGADDYRVEYTYDIAGNRKQRKVTIGAQVLITTYNHDMNTDRLNSEVHDGPEYAFLVGKDTPFYAYADSSGGIDHYRMAGIDGEIGQLRAFWMGLPSKWSQRLFRTLMALLPLVFFVPVFVRLYRRIRHSETAGVKLHLALWQRCLCVLLAYMMLLSPGVFENVARADTQYTNLTTETWHNGNRIVSYLYDDNGSAVKKTTANTGTSGELEVVDYTYDLCGRLSQVKTDFKDGTVEIADYGG